jgi:hypothetical protein
MADKKEYKRDYMSKHSANTSSTSLHSFSSDDKTSIWNAMASQIKISYSIKDTYQVFLQFKHVFLNLLAPPAPQRIPSGPKRIAPQQAFPASNPFLSTWI